MEKEFVAEAFVAMRLKLHHIACRMLRDRAEADDAVQEAFCRLWDSDTRGGDSETAARRRLVAVLRNLCIDRLRSRRLLHDTIEPDEAAAVCQPECGIDADMLRKRLLAELPPMQREVFRLVALEDYEYAEVARQLGIAEDAARANMCRARKKLQQVYRKYEL